MPRAHGDPARRIEQFRGALGDERRAHPGADAHGVAPRAGRARLQRLFAVERHHRRDQLQRVRPRRRRQRADRHLAAAAERDHERALGLERRRRRGIVNGVERVARAGVVRADLHGHDALARRGHAGLGGQAERDALRQAEAAEAGRGEHDCVEVAGVELAQARVEVAAQAREAREREQALDLRDPAHAAGAEPRRLAEHRDHRVDGGRLGEFRRGRRQHDGIERIFAGQRRGDREALGQDRRHVLGAVHGEIDPGGQQRVLDFLHEQALAADLRQRAVGLAVALGPDDDEFAGGAAGGGDAGGGLAGLPERQLAAARAEPKGGAATFSAGSWRAEMAPRWCRSGTPRRRRGPRGRRGASALRSRRRSSRCRPGPSAARSARAAASR